MVVEFDPVCPNNISAELWVLLKILFGLEINFPIIPAVTMTFCNAFPASLSTRIGKINKEDNRDRV